MNQRIRPRVSGTRGIIAHLIGRFLLMDYSRIWKYDSEFNGYDLGCGELSLDLHTHFKSLPPESRVIVITGDPGAPMDIPAWCRLTGHALLEAAHPYYLIRKKGTRGKE